MPLWRPGPRGKPSPLETFAVGFTTHVARPLASVEQAGMFLCTDCLLHLLHLADVVDAAQVPACVSPSFLESERDAAPLHQAARINAVVKRGNRYQTERLLQPPPRCGSGRGGA